MVKRQSVITSPLFSIIIPVYNVVPYLRECLDSVLAQTFSDWEAICVDDGSTDGSGVILDEYAVRDSRFRVIHQSNSGVSVARNTALDIAIGSWITFLDADDALPKDTYNKYNQLIQTYHYDAYFMQIPKSFSKRHIQWCEGDSSIIYETTPETSSHEFCGVDLLLQNFRLWGFPWIRLLRRSVFGAMRFPVGVVMMEDNISLYDNLSIKARFAVVNLVAYAYRQREESASHVFPTGRVLQIFELYEKTYDIVRNHLQMSKFEAAQYFIQDKESIQGYYREGLKNETIDNLQKISSIALWLREQCGSKLLDYFIFARCIIIKHFKRKIGFNIIKLCEIVFFTTRHRYNKIVRKK